MKKPHEYSAEELAVMSREQLIAHLQLDEEERPAHSTHPPPSESSTPPMQLETLREMGGL